VIRVKPAESIPQELKPIVLASSIYGLKCLRENPPVPQGRLRDSFSRPYTGLDFARIPYPALRAGPLSDVPSGLNPLDWWVLTQTLKPVPFEPVHFNLHKTIPGYLTIRTLMKKPLKQRLIFLNETITDRINKVATAITVSR
jgi:hypothetical protein